MSDQEDSVPIAGPGTDQDITFDELQHFWDEIDKYINPAPPRQPGDIDYQDICRHYGRGDKNFGYDTMRRLAETGRYEMLKVWDAKSKHTVKVVRKII